MKYPDIKKGIRWGCVFGGVAGVVWLGLCYWLSTLSSAAEVSISLAFQPWWKDWNISVILFFAVGLPIGVLMATRPDVRSHKKKGGT